MMQYRLQQIKHVLARLRRAVSLLNPRRIVRHFRSVSRRLDELARLIEAESAAQEGSLGATLELAKQLGLIEQRLEHVATQFEQNAVAQKSQADGVHAAITTCLDTVNAWNLDRWKFLEYEGLLRYLRRQDYHRAIQDGRLAVPRLETEHPIAISSNDTKFPRGSKNDNSIALRFNHKLYGFLGNQDRLRILDIGCAGGGFVRSLIDDGHFAVGLDGSDYPYVNQAAEWSTIPLHLFTCDISKPFRLTDRRTSEPLLFDAITAWEVMEHISEDDLPALFENLDRHLAPGGYLIFSIATFLDWDYRTGCVWHVTVKPRSWWEEWFASQGFEIEVQHPFGKDDWLRGAGQCRGDWHEDQGLGFHVVLRRKAGSAALEQSGPGWQASVA
jgi:2-polyprenyl-3-methyl-5-hydroxy-6-metoxy-1,4-benzoquinol methylase